MSAQAHAWLNASFVQKVLRSFENDQTINVKNLTAKPAVGKGENFGSDMVRISVEYSRSESGNEITEKKSAVVKIAPTTKSRSREEVVATEFNTEIEMMEKTLSKMNTILNEPGYRLSPRVLYTQIGTPSLLVIEDLAPLGYRMADRQAGLDLEHSILAIRGLAKLHASSAALWEKDPKSMDMYQKGTFHDDKPKEFKMTFKVGMRILANEILNWSELGSCGPVYSKRLLKLSEVCYEKATEVCKPKDGEFNVLNHGDVGVNNFLFRYNNDGKPTDHIFVDFQMCWWCSPAVDIIRFLNIITAEDLELHHRTALLQEYLKILTETMTELRCNTQPLSMVLLEKILKDYEILAIIWSTVSLPFVLMKKGEVMTLDEIMQQGDDFVKPAYRGLAYRRTMLRRLPAWKASGLLDL